MTRRSPRQAGFTLVEMMVGLVIMVVVSLALAGATVVGYRTINKEARGLAADQAVSSASLALVRDLSSATTITTGTISPSTGTLTVTYGSPAVTATYRIDANKNLTRSVGASTSVAARGMQTVTIARGNPACYLAVTITPSAVGAIASTLNVTQRGGAAGCF